MTLNKGSAMTRGWNAIFEQYAIDRHDFDAAPFHISREQIAKACQHLDRTSAKEPGLLCKQDTRESRPLAFRERGLFILPVKNGHYVIVKGEGYVDVPPIETPPQTYHSSFPFQLDTTQVGDSEMQHLDRAYALSLIRHFAKDDTLVLTIRGRKYTSAFNFVAGEFDIDVGKVQIEVDGGYEGEEQVVLVEAKSGNASNTIIRQLYYPFRHWDLKVKKRVSTLFFQRTKNNEYHIWRFGFDDPNDYNSIRLLNSARYSIPLELSWR